MRRIPLTMLLLSISGCVVTAGTVMPDPPPPAPVVEVWYGGQHAVPPGSAGGWCWYDGPHAHDYFPDRPDWFVYGDGFLYWRGPVVFTYYGGHPMPGGGWCFVDVAHRHDYRPPYGAGFTWRGGGWAYGGSWGPSRPPPRGWWIRFAAPSTPACRRPPARPGPVPSAPSGDAQARPAAETSRRRPRWQREGHRSRSRAGPRPRPGTPREWRDATVESPSDDPSGAAPSASRPATGAAAACSPGDPGIAPTGRSAASPGDRGTAPAGRSAASGGDPGAGPAAREGGGPEEGRQEGEGQEEDRAAPQAPREARQGRRPAAEAGGLIPESGGTLSAP